jgi:hypothetical protein
MNREGLKKEHERITTQYKWQIKENDKDKFVSLPENGVLVSNNLFLPL